MRVLQRVVTPGELDVERARKSVAEVVAGAALKRFRDATTLCKNLNSWSTLDVTDDDAESQVLPPEPLESYNIKLTRFLPEKK